MYSETEAFLSDGCKIVPVKLCFNGFIMYMRHIPTSILDVLDTQTANNARERTSKSVKSSGKVSVCW